jgi:nucleotide-binding universal stress UspA family protein
LIGRLRDSRSHVVVGTDFSEGAAAALAEAQQISHHFRSPLTIVHATPAWTERLCQTDPTAIAWLKAARLRPDRIFTRPGLAWSVLARTAEELMAGLIVIGSHGRSGYQPVGLGSTSARISLIAPCPVLIMGPRARSHTLSKAATARTERHHHPSNEAELHD